MESVPVQRGGSPGCTCMVSLLVCPARGADMGNWWKVAAAVALVIGVVVAGLAVTGIWPGPSAADRQRARAHYAQAEVHLQAGDRDAALQSLSESIRSDPQSDALRRRA